jgi:enoyl-CoA hydratase
MEEQALASGKLLMKEDGAIRWLLLNKPAKLNALDEEILDAVSERFSAWERDGEASLVVISSTSARAFCCGADIERLSAFDGAAMREWELRGSAVLDRIENSPLISVAAIPGYAMGGGLTLALACDFRVCAETSSFSQPEIQLGWIPGWGGVERLARTVGVSRAKELCMTGRRIDATEAARIGLVDRVVRPPEEFAGGSSAFVAELAAQSRTALRTIKAIAGQGDAAARSLDAFANAALLNDPRGQAAIQRFLERKK